MHIDRVPGGHQYSYEFLAVPEDGGRRAREAVGALAVMVLVVELDRGPQLQAQARGRRADVPFGPPKTGNAVPLGEQLSLAAMCRM
jgi:hypothetical protein